MSDAFDWFPDCSGKPCIVVAGGPSAKDAPLEACRGRAHVLVINEGFRLAPWADALYAADAHWWEKHKGCPAFRGLRISQADQAARMYRGLKSVALRRTRQIVRNPRGLIAAGSDDRGSGANSGFQALNLAVQFGARTILLVGYDMTIDHGVHWHGRHGKGLSNPTSDGIAFWRRNLDGTAEYLAAIGVTVINCSPISALTRYPKAELEQALEDAIRSTRLPASA